MKILYHVHIEDQLQRSIVESASGTVCRRIARFFNCEDGTLILERPERGHQWQEQIPGGEYHNILDPAVLSHLESSFITALIESNGLAPVKTTDRNGNETFWRKGGCQEARPVQMHALIEASEGSGVLGLCAPSVHPDDVVPSRQPANT